MLKRIVHVILQYFTLLRKINLFFPFIAFSYKIFILVNLVWLLSFMVYKPLWVIVIRIPELIEKEKHI